MTVFYGLLGVIIGAGLGFLDCVCNTLGCVDSIGVNIWIGVPLCGGIGAAIGFAIDMSDAAEEREREEKKKYKEAYEAWSGSLWSTMSKAEDQLKLGNSFDPNKFYNSLQRVASQAENDENYIKHSESMLRQHTKRFRNYIANNFMHGRIPLPTVLSSIMYLKLIYGNDPEFDHSISKIRELLKNIDENSYFIQFTDYGQCQLPELENLSPEELDSRIETLQMKLDRIVKSSSNLKNNYSNIDSELPNLPKFATELIWSIAVKKPFDQESFNKACNQLGKVTWMFGGENLILSDREYYKRIKEQRTFKGLKYETLESLLATIYAKNLIGGENTVKQEHDHVFSWIDAAIFFDKSDECMLLSSALAWMELYNLERDVLRYLVECKVNLTENLQERLSLLESDKANKIKFYDIEPNSGFVYDSSASEWNAEAFDVFFRKLAMSNKDMQYSLMISRWTKTLPLARGQKVSEERIEAAFKEMVLDFDGEVTVRKEKAKAINLANVGYENSFIFEFKSERNRCVSILFSSEKYGRNLNLTILTLFTPDDQLSNKELKKYASAIKDNIYIESFIESILQSLDEVIKPEQTIYGSEPVQENDIYSQDDDILSEEPIQIFE